MSKLKEVFEKLIPIYEDAIVNCPDEFKEYLSYNGLKYGLCHASEKILNICIRLSAEKIEMSFWYKVPFECQTKAEAIDCLQWRVDKMKSLISKMETTKNGTV